MSDLLSTVLLPIATEADARATCRALAPHAPDRIVAVHVIEKAGGAPDKASVEQREQQAEAIFDVVEECSPDVDVETDLLYGTDVAETIFEAAADHGVDSIVLSPRGGSRWVQLLTGDVALKIVTETDRPVVVLPDVEEE